MKRDAKYWASVLIVLVVLALIVVAWSVVISLIVERIVAK
jgi:hypothetical protein